MDHIVIGRYLARNAFEEAIAIAGGPTKLGRLVELSYQRIAQIRTIEKGWVKRADLAQKIEQETGVPAAELCRFAIWRGPERHPPKGRRTMNGHAADPERPALHAVENPAQAPPEASPVPVSSSWGDLEVRTRCSGQLALAA